MRADHALQCDERKEYQEAYKGYLATNAFIMNVLGTSSFSCLFPQSLKKNLFKKTFLKELNIAVRKRGKFDFDHHLPEKIELFL